MEISVLVENTAQNGMGHAHGLSLYIVTPAHHVLFDAGPDGALLLKNASQLGVDLSKTDIAVLSHGHYDHAGGLRAFMDSAPNAQLYMHARASLGHYALEHSGFRCIGIDPSLVPDYPGRIKLTGDCCRIDDELTLFSDIQTADCLSASNASLLEGSPEKNSRDGFAHEQSLLISQGDKLVLVSGCAHRGILNILRRACERSGRAPDHVFSGFHLTNPGLNADEPEEFVRSVGRELAAFPCVFHTGHCTGMGPFGILKEMLGSRLDYMSGGSRYEI